MVCPTPQTTNTTPEVPATYHCPFTCITSSICTSSGIPFLKRMAACFDTERNIASSSNGNGETTTRTPIWKPLFTFSFGFTPAARSARNWRSHALLLGADSGIAEARRELERIDAVAVHYADEIDVADVTSPRKKL